MFNVGDKIVGEDFLVLGASRKVTKGGDNYLDIMARTTTSKPIALKVWKSGSTPVPGEGTVITVVGVVDFFNGPQINVSKFVVNTTMDPNEFAEKSPMSIDACMAALMQLISDIENEELRAFVQGIYEAKMHKLKYVPAAVAHHHAHLGGLALHLLEVTTTARSMSYQYPDVLQDVVTAAALLHDIGKADVYDIKNGVCVVNSNIASDHIVVGLQTMAEHKQLLNGNDALFNVLSHCVASHHGLLEHGSPVQPLCYEALIVHTADKLSSDMAGMKRWYADTDDACKGQHSTGKAWFKDGARLLRPSYVASTLTNRATQVSIEAFIEESYPLTDNLCFNDGTKVTPEHFTEGNVAATLKQYVHVVVPTQPHI